MKYEQLFSPIRIGNLTLKNRFVLAPMSVHMTEDGSVTDGEIAYMERRAMGGAAMLIAGSVCVWPDGDFGGQLYIEDDSRIAGLKRLTDAIHKHNCLICAQIHHAGRETNKATTGFQPVAPSYVEPEVYSVFSAEYDPPRVLSTEEVGLYVERYAQAIRRAKDAGFDMCELHCAHGYLICSFLSPLTNHRTDKYGGSFLARMRFVKEIITRARELVGPDYPVSCRIVGDELRSGGISMDIARQIAVALEALGVVALSVSADMYPFVRTVPNMYHKPGVNLYLAENVREAVNIPVMAAGQLARPEIQLEALQKGKADIICMGRPLIADPDYPNKLQAGREQDIIYCLACNKGCHDRSAAERHIKCGANVLTGRENRPEFTLKLSAAPKKVMVVGAGPAGLEAARAAALQGHTVCLYEKSAKLGGRIWLAATPPHKGRYAVLIDNQVRALEELAQVRVHTGVKADLALVRAEAPDYVILATGSVPLVPPLAGIDSSMVLLADDVLAGNVVAGEHVLVIGGGSVGAETAHFLLEQGKGKRRVHIVELRPGIGIDLPQDARICLLRAFEQSPDLVCHISTKVLTIGSDWVDLEKEGKTERVTSLNSVVLAVGIRSDQTLLEQLNQAGIPCILAGDAAEPGDYVKAVLQGYQAALAIN